MEYQTSTVQTQGFSMDYIRFGQGRKTLVILPGLSVQSVIPSAGAITQAYQAMTDDYTVYLFERRNKVPRQYSIQDMAADTFAAMQTLGFEQIDLFGASQGGMIAMTIAAIHPSFVNKLVLGSTACRVNDQQFTTVASWIEKAQAGDAEALYLSFGRAIYPESLFEQYRKALILLSKHVTQSELSRFIILAESMRGVDLSALLNHITCPVLVLGANDDRVLGGKACKELCDCLQNAVALETYSYDSYGHAAYDTAPDYRARMLQFLRE